MKLRVIGMVKEKESAKPLEGLVVCAFDKDLLKSDFLGKAETGADGKFHIEYETHDFKDRLEHSPDVYLEIYRKKDSSSYDEKTTRPIFTTRKSIRYNASSSEKYYIEIPQKHL